MCQLSNCYSGIGKRVKSCFWLITGFMQTTGSLPDEDSFHVSRVVATRGVGKMEVQK